MGKLSGLMKMSETKDDEFENWIEYVISLGEKMNPLMQTKIRLEADEMKKIYCIVLKKYIELKPKLKAQILKEQEENIAKFIWEHNKRIVHKTEEDYKKEKSPIPEYENISEENKEMCREQAKRVLEAGKYW